MILYSMATCHSLKKVDGELVVTLRRKMFQFTGWSYEEGEQSNSEDEDAVKLRPSTARPPPEWSTTSMNESQGRRVPVELGVLKQFEFVSHLRRACVVFASTDPRLGWSSSKPHVRTYATQMSSLQTMNEDQPRRGSDWRTTTHARRKCDTNSNCLRTPNSTGTRLPCDSSRGRTPFPGAVGLSKAAI